MAEQVIRVGDVVRVPLSLHPLVAAGAKPDAEPPQLLAIGQRHAIAVVRAIADDSSNASDPKVRVDLGPGFRDAEADSLLDGPETRMLWYPLSTLAPVVQRTGASGATAVFNIDLERSRSQASPESSPRHVDDAGQKAPKEAQKAPTLALESAAPQIPAAPGALMEMLLYRLVAPVDALLAWRLPRRGAALVLLTVLLIGAVYQDSLKADASLAFRAEVVASQGEQQAIARAIEAEERRVEEEEKRVLDLQIELKTKERALSEAKDHLRSLEANAPVEKDGSPHNRQPRLDEQLRSARENIARLDADRRDVEQKLAAVLGAISKEESRLKQQRAFAQQHLRHLAGEKSALQEAAAAEDSAKSTLAKAAPILRICFWLLLFSSPGTQLASVGSLEEGLPRFSAFVEQHLRWLLVVMSILALGTALVATLKWVEAVASSRLHLAPVALLLAMTVGDLGAVAVSVALVLSRLTLHRHVK